MSCCRSLCGLSPKLSQQLMSKLGEIRRIFPHARRMVILSPEGVLLAHLDLDAPTPIIQPPDATVPPGAEVDGQDGIGSGKNGAGRGRKAGGAGGGGSGSGGVGGRGGSGGVSGGVPGAGGSAANAPTSSADELLAPIASLKKTAVQFGAALNQMECPVIHIRGNNHMFSCYDVDKNLLAFYSSMHSSLLDAFNSTEADNKMSLIIQDLRLLLQNLLM